MFELDRTSVSLNALCLSLIIIIIIIIVIWTQVFCLSRISRDLLESANLATSHMVPWTERARKHLTYTVCSLCSVGWFWDDQLRNASKICWKCGAEIEQKGERKPHQGPQKTANLVHQLKSVLGRMTSATDVPCKAQIEALLAQISSESGKDVPIDTRVGQASQKKHTPQKGVHTSS